MLDGASVDPSAVLSAGTVVGRGARIEAEAEIQGSIIAAGAVVRSKATIVDSIVAPHASIGSGSSLRQAVVADRARLGERVELTAGARVWPDIELPDVAIRFSSDA